MIDLSTLEPGIQAWLAENAAIGAALPQPADPFDFTARRARELQISDHLSKKFGGDINPEVTITEVEFAGGLYAHQLRPAGVDGPLPTQLFFHGGGFVSGTAKEHLNDLVLADRVARTGIQIISLDYRLAPEHPYPAAIEDALTVLTELADNADAWGVDLDRLGVGGGSAGGHIAAVTALRVRDLNRAGAANPRLVHALLEVPALSLSVADASMTEFSTPEDLQGALAIVQTYRGREEAADGYFDPAEVDDLEGLPRTFIMTAELDPLRDGAERYAGRLEEAGVAVSLRRGTGQLHGTQGLISTVESSGAWQEAAIAELRAAYA